MMAQEKTLPPPAKSETTATDPAAHPKKSKKVSPSRKRPETKPIDWDTISDEDLLNSRICDLPIGIDDFLQERIHTVYKELDEKGIAARPECYLGDEWFSPENEPVISIPYFLAHKRLTRLERSWALEAEGDSRAAFLKLLRHEMGHALSHAYGLDYFKGYAKVFGTSSKPFSAAYRPRRHSRRYVIHIENWYGQSHPDEDFAETFAVWLTPGIDWRVKYAGWGALEKLEFIDRMMEEVKGTKPKKKKGAKFRRLSTIRMTIAQCHKIKRKTLEQDTPEFFDHDLAAIFGPAGAGHERAARFLRRHRRMLVRNISRWTGEKRYTINDLLTRFAKRSALLRQTVDKSEAETLTQVTACISSMAANYFRTGKYKRSP